MKPSSLTQADKMSDDEVYLQLGHSISAVAGGGTPCRDKASQFTASLQSAKASLATIELCKGCPVLAECAMAASQLSTPARANSVMGGARYNPHGTRIPAELLQQVVNQEMWQHEIDHLGAPTDDGARIKTGAGSGSDSVRSAA